MSSITNYASQHCPLFGPGQLTVANEITRYDLFGQLYVGQDDTGYDVQFFGATSGVYMLWDESADRLILTGGADLELGVAGNIILDATTGTKIGTATTQKLGFYNATPAAQPSAYTQTYSTAEKTHAAMTSSDMPAGGTGAAAGGWDTAVNRDAAITDFAELRVDVIDLKQLVNAVIDDLQALGLVA